MESLTTSYKHLLIAPETVTVPAFFLATLELLIVGMLIAWFVAHAAKMLINGDRLGISNRNSLAVSWAAIILGTLAMIQITVLLILKRVPDWNAVSPHVAFAVIMGVIAVVGVHCAQTELNKHRVYVERARKTGSN
jgi:hypothetical protein